MPHFSDRDHMDTCAARWCNTMLLRSDMKKNPTGKGFLCPYHYGKLPGKTGTKK